jgi:hypothetical protein
MKANSTLAGGWHHSTKTHSLPDKHLYSIQAQGGSKLRSNSPARKRLVPSNSGDFVEAVFRPEIFKIFSNAFRVVLAGKHRKFSRIHRKNPKNFRPEYCSHVSAISGAFLQDPVTFSRLSCRIQWPESSTWKTVPPIAIAPKTRKLIN